MEDLLAEGQDPQKEEKGPQKTGKQALGPNTHKCKVEDLLAQGQHPQKAEKNSRTKENTHLAQSHTMAQRA